MILYRARRCNHTQRRQFIALLAGVAVAWPQSLIADGPIRSATLSCCDWQRWSDRHQHSCHEGNNGGSQRHPVHQYHFVLPAVTAPNASRDSQLSPGAALKTPKVTEWGHQWCLGFYT